MAKELSRAIEANRPGIELILHLGGDAMFATMKDQELPGPIEHPRGRTYTHWGLERYASYDNEGRAMTRYLSLGRSSQ